MTHPHLWMVTPDFYQVQYAINPHMLAADGSLNKIDLEMARKQWLDLKTQFEDLGARVETLPGQQGLPDMVFCANQTFPFFKAGRLQLILSRMATPERTQEVEYFRNYAQEREIPVWTLKEGPFEGMGDALWNYATGEIFGGYGFRTGERVYDEVEKITRHPVHRLKLVDERFYHLDTCLVILNKDTAAYVPEAFSPVSLNLLKDRFANLLQLPLQEAANGFAGNAFCLNGKDVILQKGNPVTERLLRENGFHVHAVDTSEFIKAGGSVFCMKMQISELGN